MGCRIVRDNRAAVKQSVRQKVSQILTETAADGVASMKARAPKRTGAMAASIKQIAVGPLRRRIGVFKHYAKYVEFGTVRMAPRPFFYSGYVYAKNLLLTRLRRLFRR